MTVRLLETRRVARNVKRRRYEREDGTRFTTLEVPVTVLGAFGRKRVDEAVGRWERGEVKRETASKRKARAQELLRQGVKVAAIAHELGVSEARARQWREEVRRG